MNLNLLRELMRAREELRRGPSPRSFKRFELLKFMGAATCPGCGQELDLARFRRRLRRGSLHEWIVCAGCSESFSLTSAALH